MLADKRDTQPAEEAWQHPALIRGAVFAQRRRPEACRRRVAPFRRVLIANRGEIAVRIIRACHELGMEAVAVYSDADAERPHVRLADIAVRIGPPPPTESYLRIDAIVEAARSTGAEAIHPGYGFLAERAAFARAVEDAGLVFVGPPSASIDALGDKLHARRTARAVGVAAVPGTLEPAPVDRPDRVAAIVAEAEAIGFPLLVKAAAGGGGRGMRRVTTAADLPAALARRVARGGVGVRRRLGLPGARDRAGAPHRGPAARRRDRPRRRDRRARLLDPAPPPEARRGGAGARV